ncbi:MAG: PAS domain S-box protein, partial [Verrucomicrobia bacterium]|nr:PAS domain S-box protein [Verrucomicrobiota bacterium]
MDRTRRSRTATGVNSVEVLEAKLHAIYQQSLIFMGILDLDGRLLDANQLAYDVCGVHPEEVIGKRFWDTDWWRGSKHSQACIKKAVASAARGEVYRADLHYTRATGGEYVVDFVMSPVRSSTGKVLFLAPLGMDITERKRAEAELARLNSHLEKRSAQRTAELIESQARLQAVTSSIHDGLVITDLDDVIQDINPRMQTLLGYSREEVLGKRVYELFLPLGESAKIREQNR